MYDMISMTIPIKSIPMISCRKWISELFSNFESVCKQWWENWSNGTKIKCCILYLSNIFSFILFDSLFLFHFWGRVIFLKNTLRIIIFCSLPFIKHTSFLPFTLLFFNFAWWLYFKKIRWELSFSFYPFFAIPAFCRSQIFVDALGNDLCVRGFRTYLGLSVYIKNNLFKKDK